MMPAGKYYVGDLCYVMDSDEWRQVCSIIIKDNQCLDGEFELPDSRRFAIYGTAYGDGEYYDQYGHTYSVDAGSIGCVLMSDIRANKYDNLLDLGAILEFTEPFETGSQGGQLQFGHVIIETDAVDWNEDEE
jgi:hypothetical protein